MNSRSIITGLLVSIVGAVFAGGAYWALLNVPESSGLALVLSAVLALLVALLVGYTASVLIALASEGSAAAAARAGRRGLPGFVVGVLVFAALFWATSTVDDLWALHRGEIDAMFLRYLGTANTGWMHTGTSWVMWLVRWGLGLALIGGATAGSLAIGMSGAVRGLGAAFALRPLLATIAGLLLGRALWPLAYWRPRALPADTAELLFVGAKLGVLILVGALVSVIVLQAFAPRRA